MPGLCVVAIAGVGVLASVELTSRSSFCNSCHIMGSFYDTWKLDTHSDVPCVRCHIPPGMTNYFAAKVNGLGQVVDDWLNRISMKPSASVSDFACTRSGCHQIDGLDRHGEDKGEYLFSHEKHLEREYLGIDITCTICHSHVKGDNHFKVNTNTCIVCHLGVRGQRDVRPRPVAVETELGDILEPALGTLSTADGSHGGPASGKALRAPTNCQSCHNPPSETFEYNGLTVDHHEFREHGAACDSCHYGVTAEPRLIDDHHCHGCHVFGMEQWTTTEEMHTAHAMGEHKVECFECHGEIAHGPEYQSLAMSNFECRACHHDQHVIQRSTYSVANGVTAYSVDTPVLSPMILTHVGCPACHIEPRPVSSNPTTGATVANAVPEACDRCHESGFGAKMIPLWQNATRDQYTQVVAMMPLAPTSTIPDDEARHLLTSARRLLDTVRLDGSWGVHNPTVTQQLIEQARDRIVRARALLDRSDEEGNR